MARRRPRRPRKLSRAERQHRALIDEETSEISNGPVTFDVKHARAWGMSDRVLESTWKQVTAIVNRASAAAVRAHPERWRRETATGQLVFVGEIHDSKAFERAQKIRGGLVPLDRWKRR